MKPFIQLKGNYKSLIAYQKAECIYDITYYFAHKYFSKGDRTIDQMVQAARSGKQNIVEGSSAATTSSETEIKLYNVARASLQELLIDYEDYLRVNNCQQWDVNSDKAKRAREACTKHNDSTYYRNAIQKRSAETIANIAITLIHQEDVFLRKMIEKRKNDFLKEGGIREQMTAARLEYKKNNPKK
ncbi:MAG: four helix bundle protein [Lentimicrobiaceae bacterium]|nr:four helix bundle protein [Lentimicrobiaceae bacterium]